MFGGVRTRSLAASFALSACVLAIPLVALTVTAVAWYVGAERARLTAVARLTGDHLRERLDRDLAEMTALARALATSPSIDTGDDAAFDAQARAVVTDKEVTVVLSELDGRQRVNTRARPGEALPTVPRPDIVEALLRARAPSVSGLLVSGLTGRRIVAVSAPVIRDGLVRKFVAVAVRIEHFERLIEEEGIEQPYSAGITDGQGRVLVLTAGAPVIDASVEALARSQPVRAAAVRDGEGQDGTIVFRHGSKRSDWVVATGVEKAALEAPLRHSLILLAAIGLALACAAGLIALPSVRRSAMAVRALAAAAERVGRGQQVALEPSGIREVDTVGRALCEASDTLGTQRAMIEAANTNLAARAEERDRALASSRAHYRALAENVGDVIVLRRHGSYELAYISPSSTRVFGHDPETIMSPGYRLADDIHPEDRPAVAAIEAALGAGRQSVTCLFRTRRKDGRWIWVESVTNRIGAAGPDEPDVVSVLRDVTERQAHAEELRIARDMAELAQAKAENANRAKSEFLAVMSHEIRTPLSTIKGFTELLADTAPLSAEQSRYIALVDDATATMLMGVDDIIDFARIESGDLRIESRAFALGPAVEGVVAFLRPAAARRGVAVGATLAPDLPPFVLGDERRLRQILLSLLNALLRSHRGGLVTVSATRRRGATAAGDRLGIAVSASGGRAAASEGCGLGPAIAQRLIGLMGGRLESTAGPGEPSSYRLALQLPVAEAADLPEAAPLAAPSRPARLLIVDDHPMNREVATRLLERAGHAVDTAADGAEALAAVQAHTYDVVLMDVQMPGMDGLTATRRIRALQHPSRQVPILAMTANVLPEQVRGFHEAGMNGHVGKPVDRKSLYAAVEAQLASTLVLESRRDPGGEAPTIFDRAAYDGLRSELGLAGADGVLRGFVALLDAVHEGAHAGDTSEALAAARGEAGAVAVAARRLGFLDLASAHERLAQTADAEAARAALRRARVARELAQRVFGELGGAERGALVPQVALL